MRHHQIPSIIKDVSHVALIVVLAAIVSRQQIARPRIVPALAERTAHRAGVFTPYEYAQ
jgi:hypothetical protein